MKPQSYGMGGSPRWTWPVLSNAAISDQHVTWTEQVFSMIFAQKPLPVRHWESCFSSCSLWVKHSSYLFPSHWTYCPTAQFSVPLFVPSLNLHWALLDSLRKKTIKAANGCFLTIYLPVWWSSCCVSLKVKFSEHNRGRRRDFCVCWRDFCVCWRTHFTTQWLHSYCLRKCAYFAHKGSSH